jgi:predicted methyltransferase
MGQYGIPGASLQGWKKYFINSKIYGADIDKNILFKEDRIKTYYCNQTKPIEIITLFDSLNIQFDIIVEDGLHTFDANIIFLNNAIHYLKKGGYYIIEDVQPKDDSLWKSTIPKLKKTYNLDYIKFIKFPNRSDGGRIIIILK